MHNINNIYKIVLGLGLTLSVISSTKAESYVDSVLLSAMKHELKRNMEDLVKENHDKPFFISYTIADVETYSASASLGALYGSNSNQYKDWSIRVMVGDYELNDENFVSNETPRQVSRITQQMPVENDYMGIRMALWSHTDNIYNRAAAQYKQKKRLIEEDKVEKEQLGIADFSKVESVQKVIPRIEEKPNKDLIDQRVREISKIFIDYPEILSSNVSMNQILANVYFLTGEGTEIVYPMDFVSIKVNLNTVTENKRKKTKNLSYRYLSVKDLPGNDVIKRDIEYTVKDIIQSSEQELFDDEYTGPVMYTGNIVPKKLASALFSGKSKLIANREPLKRNDQKDTYYDSRDKTKQWSLGKKVFGKDINVTEYSSMKKFQGIPLWGNYEIDAEGVIPTDSIVLIENGLVKNKLNGRTPTKEVDSTNGHMRHGISQQGLRKSIAPGIVKISSNKGKSYAQLKELLIEKAKEENLDYGILIKPAPLNTSNTYYQVYKVSVETGEEIRIYGTKVSSIDIKDYKNDVTFSDSLIVHNGFFGSQGSSSGGSLNTGGAPASFIAPSAMLVNELDVSPAGVSYSKKDPVVASPLAKED